MGSWSFFIFFLLIRKKENPVLVDHRIYLYTDFPGFQNSLLQQVAGSNNHSMKYNHASTADVLPVCTNDFIN